MFKKMTLLLLVLSLVVFLTTPLTAKNLLVIGDRANSSDAAILAAMEASGKKFDVYELSKSGPLTPYKIFEYAEGLIVRAQSEEKYRMAKLEAEVMWEFLLTQGQLFLFGTEFHPDVYKTEFPTLLMSKPNGQATVDNFQGVQFDLVSHDLTLKANKKTYNAITPDDKGEAVLVLSGDKLAAIKGQSCSYRILYCTFQPGDVTDTAAFNKFVEKGLNWFHGNQMGIGVVAPDSEVMKLDGSFDGLYSHLPPANKLTIIEFFATWCSVCKKQRPILVELAKEYKDEIGITGVIYKEEIDVVKQYLSEHPEVSWPVIIDKRGVASNKYGVKALPKLFILDHERKVHYIGNFTTKATLVDTIEKLLKSSKEQIKTEDLNQR